MIERKTTEEIIDEYDGFGILERGEYELSTEHERYLDKVWLSEDFVREVLEKHKRRPRAEGQSVRHQEMNRTAERKIKQIIEELGL